MTDVQWLAAEYPAQWRDGKARAEWVARTVNSGTNWAALAVERPVLPDEPNGRILTIGAIEIVAYRATIGPFPKFWLKEKPPSPTRGASLLLWFPQIQPWFDVIGLSLKVAGGVNDPLRLSGEDDQSARKLITAVKARFGEGPSKAEEPSKAENWITPAVLFPRLSGEEAASTTLPPRRKAQSSSLSRTPKQNVAPSKEPKTAAPRQPVTAVEASQPAATSPSAVFISYSHKDNKWLAKLQIHLKPLERQGHIDLWADDRIHAGDEWRKEIERAISSCKIAILLVSPNFMASDFIDHDELPPLLKRAKSKGVRIISIIISPSSYEGSELARYQAVNPPSKPLRALKQWEQDKVFVEVHDEVKRALGI